MLSLIETLTAFAAIMLMLSLLVKTLTSVIKNQLDYYSDNLKHEVERLVLETTDKTWDSILQSKDTPPRVKNILMDIHWERLGDEFLSPSYLSWFLKQLDQNARVSDLESRLKIHIANVKYTFEMRMKNLALAVGLGLCLLCDINAFTIWKSLYTDQQLRATFSDRYAEKATTLANAQAIQGADPSKKPTKDELNAQIKSLRENMQGFLADVSFGVGRIWRDECLRLTEAGKQECQKELREKTAKLRQDRYGQRIADAENAKDSTAKDAEKKAADEGSAAEAKADAAQAELKLAQEKKDTQSAPGILIYEFFGSLLTGILVSIGAPYWHDFLQALSSLRFTGSAAKAKA
jgi:hypothetical protein